jgi:hypothetical protein
MIPEVLRDLCLSLNELQKLADGQYIGILEKLTNNLQVLFQLVLIFAVTKLDVGSDILTRFS